MGQLMLEVKQLLNKDEVAQVRGLQTALPMLTDGQGKLPILSLPVFDCQYEMNRAQLLNTW